MPDHPPPRCEPFLNSQQECRTVGKTEFAQYGARAKGCLAHQIGAMCVLQSPRHDLCGAGSAGVDQNHHGDIGCSAARPHLYLLDLPFGVLFQQYVTTAEKLAGDANRLVQQAAGIIAQVQNKPGHSFLLDLAQRLFQVVRNTLAKAGYP